MNQNEKASGSGFVTQPVTRAASKRAHCGPTSSAALGSRSWLSAHAAISGPSPSCCTNLQVKQPVSHHLPIATHFT